MGGAGQLLSAIGWVSFRILPKHLSSVQRDDDRTLKDCEDINSKQLGGRVPFLKAEYVMSSTYMLCVVSNVSR